MAFIRPLSTAADDNASRKTTAPSTVIGKRRYSDSCPFVPAQRKGLKRSQYSPGWATTRSESYARVSKFMNGFKKRGFVRYNGGLQINSALITAFLQSRPMSVARNV
jgi:hypothetical protein